MPRVGFREYWYPCVWSKEVGRKPKNIKMLGEELVLFRGKKGNVVALNEWCPHRGARLSRGFCEFEGTVTCPYHGYTFDETGTCVAGLIESTDSPLVGKMRTKVYPTAEWNDIVLVWMGETDPVPFEEDLPYEFSDSTLTGRKYTRVKMWETNWTEPMNQGIDYHEFYLHRGLNFWRFVDWRFPFWRPKSVSTGGTEIVSEGEDNFWVKTAEAKFGHAEYPGLGKWPRKTWWRKLPSPKTPNAGMIATATGEKAGLPTTTTSNCPPRSGFASGAWCTCGGEYQSTRRIHGSGRSPSAKPQRLYSASSGWMSGTTSGTSPPGSLPSTKKKTWSSSRMSTSTLRGRRSSGCWTGA